jgi:hypothetical protein
MQRLLGIQRPFSLPGGMRYLFARYLEEHYENVQEAIGRAEEVFEKLKPTAKGVGRRRAFSVYSAIKSF